MSPEPKAGLIGASVPRAAARRSVAGRGQYTDDIRTADAVHVAFLRSPYPHARIVSIDLDAVCAATGVIAAYSGRDLAAVCGPWTTALARLPAHVSAPQYPIAVEETCFQGEAVVAVVGETRALAEDALDQILIDFEELPFVASIAEAGAEDAPPVHTSLRTNLAIDHTFSKGDVAAAFEEAAVVVESRFEFGRQTGVTLEPRSILARFDPVLGELTVHQSHQVPFQMREIFAAQLGLSPERVRVVAPDVGGAFGLKLHAYPDEMAVVAIATLVDRPVKFVADRLESFVSDAHAREAEVTGRMAFDASGTILGVEVDVRAGFGAYSTYPRGSVGESLQAGQLAGAPYAIGALRARVRGYYQNKVPTGALRGVGQPIACAVTERLVDLGAERLDLDPAALRARNFREATEGTSLTEGGVAIETLSLQACLARLKDLMAYEDLRRDQAQLRRRGIFRGIGLSAFLEITGVGPGLYGPQGLRVSAQEACRLTLTETGTIRCETSTTDQGQGTLGGLVQVIAEELGVGPGAVVAIAGDTARTPYGGGAWASRGISLGGEAALRAARKLRANLLMIAASLMQCEPESLTIADGCVRRIGNLPQITLADLAATVRFKSDQIPLADLPPLEVVEHVVPASLPYLTTNGVQAALVEVDVGTGLVRVLDFWVADDCGRIVNPMLVDEQIRGGVVQGISAALYEQCRYSPEGQMTNGTLVDYPLPLATEMPDIQVVHVTTPTRATALGARGVGEAGVVGSIAALWSAVNDALLPFGSAVTCQPFTPDRIIEALGNAVAGDR